VDVKLSYSPASGLVVKSENAGVADLKDVVYIEFTHEAKNYRISVSGGKPGSSAAQT